MSVKMKYYLILFLMIVTVLSGVNLSLAEGNDSQNSDEMSTEKPYIIVKRDDITAVIVNNEAVDDSVLPGHTRSSGRFNFDRGLSGVGSLKHSEHRENVFLDRSAGLNFEHIHDGTNGGPAVLFEARVAEMQIRQTGKYKVQLHQGPTRHWQLESWITYELLEGGVIEMTFECVPRARTFEHDYIGLFFASYIEHPESKAIYFKGYDKSESDRKERWIKATSPSHGVEAAHRGINDERVFPHDPNFKLTLAFNESNYRYSEPWYYGISNGMALVFMFRDCDQV